VPKLNVPLAVNTVKALKTIVHTAGLKTVGVNAAHFGELLRYP